MAVRADRMAAGLGIAGRIAEQAFSDLSRRLALGKTERELANGGGVCTP
jgi:hypothetical protein